MTCRTEGAIPPTSFEHIVNGSHLQYEGRGLRATGGGQSLVCFSFSETACGTAVHGILVVLSHVYPSVGTTP